MKTQNDLFISLTNSALTAGAHKAAVIETKSIETDLVFREICEKNACGGYGRCWMCPPDVGAAEKLIASIGEYDYALVYQYVGELEDSFDFEGMEDAKKLYNKVVMKMRELSANIGAKNVLNLGAGGCGVCERCSKRDGLPCRAPELATPSLEAYCINVSKLAASAGMKYINGANTVTYFGAVLFSFGGEENE